LDGQPGPVRHGRPQRERSAANTSDWNRVQAGRRRSCPIVVAAGGDMRPRRWG